MKLLKGSPKTEVRVFNDNGKYNAYVIRPTLLSELHQRNTMWLTSDGASFKTMRDALMQLLYRLKDKTLAEEAIESMIENKRTSKFKEDVVKDSKEKPDSQAIEMLLKNKDVVSLLLEHLEKSSKEAAKVTKTRFKK